MTEALSYALLETRQVKDVGLSVVEHIKNKRAALKEVAILKAMEPIDNWFWSYNPTRRDAERGVEKDRSFRLWDFYGWGTLNVAENLVNLARACQEPFMSVTADDFSHLSFAWYADPSEGFDYLAWARGFKG